jgi:death on curing protein
MPEPLWVREDVALSIHRRLLAEHGGREGVRDTGLLASALARPRNLHAYSEPKPDLAAMAAAYAFGIVKDHPFIDGNKRTAFVVCRTFILLNGRDLDSPQEEKYLAFMNLAGGELSEEALAAWLRSRIVRTRRKRS